MTNFLGKPYSNSVLRRKAGESARELMQQSAVKHRNGVAAMLTRQNSDAALTAAAFGNGTGLGGDNLENLDRAISKLVGQSGITTSDFLKEFAGSDIPSPFGQVPGISDTNRTLSNYIRVAHKTESDLCLKSSDGNPYNPRAELDLAAGSKNPSALDPDKIGLSIFEVLSPNIGLNNHNQDILMALASGVPTHVLNSRIPFLRVTPIGVGEQMGQNTDRGIPPSISLEGYFDNKYSPGSPVNFGKNAADEQMFHVDPGIFWAPQSLTSAPGQRPGARPYDSMRPLLSLAGFSVSVVGVSAGMFTNKSAKLAMILHDSARLKDVATWIRTSGYAKAKLLIEWGWSTPEGMHGDPWMRFWDTQKSMEIWTVSNSSFTFREDQSVEISLSLNTTNELEKVDLTSGELIGKREFVDELMKAVRTIANKTEQRPNGETVALFESSTIKTLGENSSISHITGDKKLLLEIRKHIDAGNKKGASPDSSELSDKLEALFGSSPDRVLGGGIKELQTVGQNEIAKAWKRIREQEDPWLDLLVRENKVANRQVDPIKASLKNGGEWMSLAHILNQFVSGPLISTGTYAEVQWVYHPANKEAGWFWNTPLSMLPIHQDEFTALKEDMLARFVGGQIGLATWIEAINGSILAQTNSKTWGLSSAFTQKKNSEKKKVFELRADLRDHGKFEDYVSTQLQAAYGVPENTKVKFKIPQLRLIPEVVPMEIGNKGEIDGSLILRMHIVDLTASSYANLSDLLEATRRNNLNILGERWWKEKAASQNDISAKVAAKFVNDEAGKLLNAGIVEKFERGDGSVGYRIKGGIERIKSYMRRELPYFVPFSEGSVFKSFSISSIGDASSQTVELQRTMSGQLMTPRNVDDFGLPLRIQPVEAEAELEGSPFLQFGSQFFVDMLTGTSADDIYAIVSVEHSIDIGKFNTKVKMRPVSSTWASWESTQAVLNEAIGILKKKNDLLPI